MIAEINFNRIMQKQKKYKYSSMNYIEYEDCKNSEILFENEGLVLLHDKSRNPGMLYFAADDFEKVLTKTAEIQEELRIHFVPREYANRLIDLGFVEWGEYMDFFNYDLAATAASFAFKSETEFLKFEDCDKTAELSQKCRLQSRGYEGESAIWFQNWICKNKVIIVRKDTEIAGFCCVSIYNNGTTLWIREIAVAPEFQSMGFGKELIEKAIEYGVENKAVKGFLAADVLNKNAIGLYKKYDFHGNFSESELQMIRN